MFHYRQRLSTLIVSILLSLLTLHADARRDDDEQPSPPSLAGAETAKTIAVELAPVSTFDLSPRSVNDILATLEKYSREVTPSQQRFLEIINQMPPTNRESLLPFLMQRAHIRRQLGRFREGIADATAVLEAGDSDLQIRAYQELGAYYDELGDFEKAVQSLESALQLSTRDDQRFIANTIMAIDLAFLGRLDESAEALKQASRFSPSRLRQGEWLNFYRSLGLMARGSNAFYSGKYDDAISVFTEAAALNDRDIENGVQGCSHTGTCLEDFNQRSRGVGLRYVALSLVRQGQVAEAESLAREVVTGQARYFGAYSGQTAEGLGTLTEILAEQGRSEDTAKLARATLDVYDRMGADTDSVTRGAVRRALADALVASGDWEEALREYQAIERDLSDPEKVLLLFQFNLTWAIPSLTLGNPKPALGRLQAIAARLNKNVGPDRYETAEADGFVASTHEILGNTAEALSAFERSVPILLARTNQSDSEEQSGSGRLMRQRFILEHYIAALIRRGRSGDVEEAFRIANAAHASRVDEALAAAAARAALVDPKLATLARDEQDALSQIKAFNGLLAQSGGRGPTDRKLRQQLLGQIRTLKDRRESILSTIAKQAPEYVRLIDPQPSDVASVQANLQANEALIMTYTTREETYVWVVGKTGKIHHAVVKLPQAALEQTVSRLREALAPEAETLADLPPFDVALAYRLYQLLLEPVEPGWREASSLIVVPHGMLASLPLAVLPTAAPRSTTAGSPMFAGYRAVPWLIRSHALTTLPSVSSLIALRAQSGAAHAAKPFLGFGDPVFDPNDTSTVVAVTRSLRSAMRAAPNTRAVDSAQLLALPRLPETAEELLAIANAVGADPAKDVFLRREANEAKVKSLSTSGVLANYRVVSFATHGLVPGDLDGLMQPALALSSPQAAKIEGDGLLDMAEILTLKLNADWAVLSACNTASADGGGAEAVSGLGRAFFYAGTRALLVSNWPVHSGATTYLMSDLFRRHGDGSKSRDQSLREAMLQTMDEGGYVDNGQVLFSYAHPLFWAPFSLVGDGGG